MLLILLDSKRNMLREQVLSIGTSHSTLVSPRDICIAAVKNEASYFMIMHNHPSGNPNPSRQDMLVTQKIKEVSDLIEIPLLDHIIIGDNRYISFVQKGLL
jgi:DNA repair protein RadC